MFVAAPPGPPKRKCLCDAGAGGKKAGTRKAESVAELCPSTSCRLPVRRGDAREHPLPTRPLPTTETDPLGVGGGPQLLKWSVSISAGLWSWTGLGLERLGPRRRCTSGQSIRHSPLASLLIIRGISGILHLDHLIVLFWNWCISCSLAELSFVCIYLKENQCLKRPMYLIL